ncbi:queD-like protein [Shewanella maritima]|uniref:QueD-like protein n=1 Tax=Shewanella maritima TaxID=2520507 RepID=A0A411PMI6_9GAMM|nr:VC2046/SO_2500 family protein [Shewanella maritima]QBF84701.1 queD-like protein [Shewanella maritima]
MQIESALVNELHLGTRLNQDIHQNQRGDFGLILAMLSVDARDMAQFELEKHLSLDQKLAKELQLPPKQPLLHDLSQQSDVVDHAHVFQQQGQSQFNLSQALLPEPQVIRGENDLDMQLCLSNCSHLTQLKHKGQQNSALGNGAEVNLAAINYVSEIEQQRTMAKCIQVAA